MRPVRNLIVNADDLGMSASVNAGIFRAHEHGIVTSTSLMVRQGAAREATTLAAEHPRLAIGMHLDLGHWDYVKGEWIAAYQRCDQDDERAVLAECRAQLDAFRALLGRDPTHLDSHQHVHNAEPVASVMTTLAAELGVPLRGRQVRYEGSFYGQTGKGDPLPEGITSGHLATLIRALPSGWTELGCHPGIDGTLASSYGQERRLELQALCDPLIAELLRDEGVCLRSFAELGRRSSSGS